MRDDRLFDTDMFTRAFRISHANSFCGDYIEEFIDSEIRRNIKEFANEVIKGYFEDALKEMDEAQGIEDVIKSALAKRGIS